MGQHNARIWLAGSQNDRLDVVVDLDDERLSITSNGASIGDWAMAEVEIVKALRNLHVFVEGEHLVIAPTDPELVAHVDGIHDEPAEVSDGVASFDDTASDRMVERRTQRGAHLAPARMRWKWGRPHREAGSHG